MVKDYAWSTPQLRKLDVPVCNAPLCARATLPKVYSREAITSCCLLAQVDVEGKPWPLDAQGHPILTT